MQRVVELTGWFVELVSTINCSTDASSYVAGVLASYALGKGEDMSGTSVVLQYASANSFSSLQRLADWSLYVCSVHPLSVTNVRKVVSDVGSMSYASCYRMVNRSWPVYLELSRDLEKIAHAVHDRITVQSKRVLP